MRFAVPPYVLAQDYDQLNRIIGIML